MSAVEGEVEDRTCKLLHSELRQPPYKESEARSIKGSWKIDSRERKRLLPAVTLTKGELCIAAIVVFICIIFAVVLGYVAGFLVGPRTEHFSCTQVPLKPISPSVSIMESDRVELVESVVLNVNDGKTYNWGSQVTANGSSKEVFDVFTDLLDTNDIHDYLSKLTKDPHIAGSDTNRDLAMYVFNEWNNYKFDSVEVINYTVLLSYPDKENPNSLRLKDSTGSVLYESHIAEEPPLTDDEKNPDVAAPFNAYSGNGTVTGPLVYVNYGRIDDFMYLTNGTVLKLDLSKYICVARYGGIYRGDKAHFAQLYGCKGLLIYSDPEDYAYKGTSVYPDGPSLPLYGIQRGTLLMADGDPQTPGIPSILGMYRRPYSEVQNDKVVPTIPVQPVSYGDIAHFMDQLTEHPAPDGWVGGLNLTYNIVQGDDSTNVTELSVNVFQTQKTIPNVVAQLYGGVEPDHQVVLGNHRDAWVFGAADPNSGTAILMDIAKAIGKLRADYDWRPGRTIMLCSWDAEEYGLIGSMEFVEDFGKLLETSTVAYLNVDVAVSGSLYASVSANPLLYEPVWQAAKSVPSPNNSSLTLYDDWLKESSKTYANGEVKPKITGLGSGSDFTGFLQLYGISCADFFYQNATSYSTGYAVYHSVHDNFYWMTHFGDPDFSHHKALGLLWVNMALSLTTTPVFTGRASDFGFIVSEIFQELSDNYDDILEHNGVTLDFLSESVADFGKACNNYDEERKNLTSSVSNIAQELHLIRIVNNQLMNVERAFIHSEGLPGRPYYRHVIFAPSSVNSYGSSVFPGISDAIFNALQSGGDDPSTWEEVKKQIDIVRTHLRHASQILRQPSLHYAPMM